MNMKKIRIGVSKLAPNYGGWLRKVEEGTEVINFYEMAAGEAEKECLSLSGILLTGGSDIHPGLYDREEDLPFCQNIDDRRDELELMLIRKSLDLNIPLFGICRGLQILNVAMKGTLYCDIPTYAGTTVVHGAEKDVYHVVKVEKNSALFDLSGVLSEQVTSSHHQVINDLASGLRATAFGPDGLIEAVEIRKEINHPFCIAVQWHPERMDFDNPLSGKLGKGFLEAARRK